MTSTVLVQWGIYGVIMQASKVIRKGKNLDIDIEAL
jgi:hypothetical protein